MARACWVKHSKERTRSRACTCHRKLLGKRCLPRRYSSTSSCCSLKWRSRTCSRLDHHQAEVERKVELTWPRYWEECTWKSFWNNSWSEPPSWTSNHSCLSAWRQSFIGIQRQRKRQEQCTQLQTQCWTSMSASFPWVHLCLSRRCTPQSRRWTPKLPARWPCPWCRWRLTSATKCVCLVRLRGHWSHARWLFSEHEAGYRAEYHSSRMRKQAASRPLVPCATEV